MTTTTETDTDMDVYFLRTHLQQAYNGRLVRSLEDTIPALLSDRWGEKLREAGSAEKKAAVVAAFFANYPDELRTIVDISHARLALAFGNPPNLKEQGALVTEFGEASVKAAARQWGTSIGSRQPGRDPDASTKKANDKKDQTEEQPSKNPWHPSWRATQPFKNEAEKQRLRLDAQQRIIKHFGTGAATRMARGAGVTLGGQPLRK